MKIKIFLSIGVLSLFSAFLPVSAATPEELACYNTCYKKCTNERLEYYRQHFNYGDLETCDPRCYKECSIKTGSTPPPMPPASKPVIVPDQSAKYPEQKNKYRDAYYNKCSSEKKHFAGYFVDAERGVAECCRKAADDEATSMEKRGAFDTPTSATPPVFVVEAVCKPVGITKEQSAESEVYIEDCIQENKISGWYEENARYSCVGEARSVTECLKDNAKYPTIKDFCGAFEDTRRCLADNAKYASMKDRCTMLFRGRERSIAYQKRCISSGKYDTDQAESLCAKEAIYISKCMSSNLYLGKAKDIESSCAKDFLTYEYKPPKKTIWSRVTSFFSRLLSRGK